MQDIHKKQAEFTKHALTLLDGSIWYPSLEQEDGFVPWMRFWAYPAWKNFQSWIIYAKGRKESNYFCSSTLSGTEDEILTIIPS